MIHEIYSKRHFDRGLRTYMTLCLTRSQKAEPRLLHSLPRANFGTNIQSTASTRPAGLKQYPVGNDTLVVYVIPTSTEFSHIKAQAVFHQDLLSSYHSRRFANRLSAPGVMFMLIAW